MSRLKIREALKILIGKSLITSSKGRRSQIASEHSGLLDYIVTTDAASNSNWYSNLCHVRMALESEAAGLAASDYKDIDLSYVYEIPSTSYRYLSNNDTYDQMKSSGSLRYIKDTALLSMMIEYSNLSKATEFRSVVQEYDYTANEFQSTLNKYVPIEIAANKRKSVFNYPERFIADSNDKKFYEETIGLIKNKNFILPNDKIQVFKNDLVPVIYRRSALTSATMNFMHMTKNTAEDLLKYYKTHNQY